MNVLMILPAGPSSADGRNADEYARRFIHNQDRILILYPENSAGDVEKHKSQSPYQMGTYNRTRIFLTNETRMEIINFSPDIVQVWATYSSTLLAGIEAAILTDSPLLMYILDDLRYYFRRRSSTMINDSTWDLVDNGINSKEELLNLISKINLDRLLSPSFRVQDGEFDPLVYYFATQLATAFVGVWSPLKDYYEAKYHKPATVMAPGYSADEHLLADNKVKELRNEMCKKLAIPQNSVFIGYSGSVRHIDEEFLTFLHAFKLAVKQCPNLHLIIWGSDWIQAKTEYHIQSLEISANVHRFGYLPEAQTVQCLQMMDILSCCGFNSSFNRLRLPSRLCRFFALGKPVILNHAGFGESLVDKEEAVITYTDDASEWADKMVEMATDSKLLAKLSAGAKQAAERCFNQDVNFEHIRDFFSQQITNYKQEKEISKSRYWHAVNKIKEQLHDSGVQEIAFYGAGLHTQRILENEWLNDFKIVCILDDKRQGELCGIPVFQPDNPNLPKWDKLLISSDTYQYQMLEQARALGLSGIISMYPEVEILDIWKACGVSL